MKRLGVASLQTDAAEGEALPTDRNDGRRYVPHPDVGDRPCVGDGGIPAVSDPGAYDTTPDWNPAIGFLDDERYAVMGMSGHGLKLAPAIAECAAAQIAGREPPIDITPLRPQRFAEGDLLRLAYGPGARA